MLDHNAIDPSEPRSPEESARIIADLIDKLRSREVADWEEKQLLLFAKENGEVELWGPRNLSARVVALRSEVESIDYDSPRGIQSSSLSLLATAYARPLLTISDMAREVSRCLVSAGQDSYSALAAAFRHTYEFVARPRKPYVTNLLRQGTLLDDIRRETQAAEISDELDALYTSTVAASNRTRADEQRSVRRAVRNHDQDDGRWLD